EARTLASNAANWSPLVDLPAAARYSGATPSTISILATFQPPHGVRRACIHRSPRIASCGWRGVGAAAGIVRLPEVDTSLYPHRAVNRRAAARTNKAGVQLALLASCAGKRGVVEYARPVLDELDAAVEGSAIDHVERDVGVAVVDAFRSRGAGDHREHHDPKPIDETTSQ